MRLALIAFFAVILPVCASAQTLTIAWDPATQAPDAVMVSGYVVYIGTQPGAAAQSFDVGPVTQYAYTAPEQRTYYVSVSAYGFHEGARLEGAKSVEISGSPSTPTPSTESPEGAKVPPSSSITDATGAIFQLGAPYAPAPGNYALLRNGVNTGGIGSYFVYLSRVVYTLGTDKLCYSYTGATSSGWQSVGSPLPCEPGVVIPPDPQPLPDTQPPTISMTVGRRTGNNYPVTLTNVTDIGGSGISHVEVFVDDELQWRLVLPSTGVLGSATAVWTAKVLIRDAGAHVISAKAYDVAGNVTTTSTTVKR